MNLWGACVSLSDTTGVSPLVGKWLHVLPFREASPDQTVTAVVVTIKQMPPEMCAKESQLLLGQNTVCALEETPMKRGHKGADCPRSCNGSVDLSIFKRSRK